MWFIGVEVEQETSAPPPKKIPGSAPVNGLCLNSPLGSRPDWALDSEAVRARGIIVLVKSN